MAKNNLRRKQFILLTVYNPSSNEARAEIQAGQKTRGMNWYRGHGGILLTGLLSTVYSDCFLMYPEPPAQKWHQPQWNGLPHINHQLRKCSRACLWLNTGGIFNCGPLFSDNSSLCLATTWPKASSLLYSYINSSICSDTGDIWNNKIDAIKY